MLFFRESLIATLLAFILVLPSLSEWSLSNGNSPFSLNGVDEYYYLPLMLNYDEANPFRGFYDSSAPNEFTDSPEPIQAAVFINSIFRKFFSWLHLGILEANLLLDFLFVIFSYFAFSLLYRNISGDILAARMATVITIVLPWSYWPEYYLNSLPQFPIDGILSSIIGPHTTLPALRSLYTQVSLPLFALSLSLFIRAFKRDSGRKRLFFLSGIVHGLCLWAYIFAWLSVGAIIFFSFIGLLFDPISKRRKILKGLLTFSVGTMLTSMPPLVLITRAQGYHTLQSEVFGQYWYFSPIAFVIGLLGLYLAHRRQSNSSVRLTGLLIFGIGFGQLLLMNLQPLTCIWMAPFRSPQMYLHPLFGGLLANLLFSLLMESSSNFVRRMTTVLAGIFFFSCVAFSGKTIFQQLANEEINELRDLPELIDSIERLSSKDDVFGVLTTQTPFQKYYGKYFNLMPRPNIVYALSGRKVLFQNWSLLPMQYASEEMERELLLGWLITGIPQLISPCIDSEQVPVSDLFTLTWTATLIHRAHQCRETERVRTEFEVCEALQRYRVDHLVLSEHELPLLQVPTHRALERRWTSSNGDFFLYSFPQKEFLSLHCGA